MFEHISTAPADPILGLAEVFITDSRSNKINLGIGVYKDADDKTPVLESVKRAERYLLDNETTKNYLSIEGLASFASHTQRLIFGDNSPVLSAKRAKTAQTPGGTGALRVAADFIANQTSAKRVWLSKPSWPNHKNIFQAAGLQICEYDYYDAQNKALDFNGLLSSLQQVQLGDVVILHACCHNPSGVDPSKEQWQQLAEVAAAGKWLPLFDFAYQGFGHGLEEDAYAIRTFAEKVPELIIANSYSKNFGLYNERVGGCTLVAANQDIAEAAFSQIKSAIRSLYSNPPAHGASVVATILGTPELRTLWEQELTTMRERIQKMRHLFVQTLHDKGAQQDFSFIIQQNGMFSFSGLTKEQVARLKEEFAVYAVASGRINVAGMTLNNMDPLCAAIVAVL
ncbi:MAG: amino acid aminotransferase [Enterobacteriaceae bacterium]